VVTVQERGLSDRQVLEVGQWSAKHKVKTTNFFYKRSKSLWKKELRVELRLWEKRIEEELSEKINAAALAASESTWPIPVNILRKCWRMLDATADSTISVHQTNPRTIRRDILFGSSRSGGYLVLMSVGVYGVVALRVLGKIR